MVPSRVSKHSPLVRIFSSTSILKCLRKVEVLEESTSLFISLVVLPNTTKITREYRASVYFPANFLITPPLWALTLSPFSAVLSKLIDFITAVERTVVLFSLAGIIAQPFPITDVLVVDVDTVTEDVLDMTNTWLEVTRSVQKHKNSFFYLSKVGFFKITYEIGFVTKKI